MSEGKHLIEKTLQNKDKNRRFYMPGHKGRPLLTEVGMTALDVTELFDTDNLYEAEGLLKRVEEKIAHIYGAEASYMGINGATGGLLTALHALLNPGYQILLPTDSHRSVYSGLAMCGANPVFIKPDISSLGFAKAVSTNTVSEALGRHPDVSGMVLTSPTYYGTVSEVRAIADVLHAHNKWLLVDEAHGAHLAFYPEGPESALSAGADIVVQSVHKILGGFNQTALIHLQGNRVDRERLALYRAMLSTSSPSYLLLASLEAAVDQGRTEGPMHWKAVDAAHRRACERLGEALYAEEHYDRSKFLLVFPGEGREIYRHLEAEGFQCELALENVVLAMTGMGTDPAEIGALVETVARLKDKGFGQKEIAKKESFFFSVPQLIISLEEGLRRPKKKCSFGEAVGKISADFVIPYPPGVPCAVPGSLLTEELVAGVQGMVARGDTVLGVHHGQLMVSVPIETESRSMDVSGD